MRKDSSRRPPEAPSWQEPAEEDPEQAVEEMKQSLERAKALVRRARRSLTRRERPAPGTGEPPRR